MLLNSNESSFRYPLVDANMRELKATGFQSNRGRQNVCSFLTIDLNMDWRYGAEYFEETLIDYDVHSNWLVISSSSRPSVLFCADALLRSSLHRRASTLFGADTTRNLPRDMVLRRTYSGAIGRPAPESRADGLIDLTSSR